MDSGVLGESMGAIPWHSLPGDVVLRRLVSGVAGLTADEAEARQGRFGSNEIEQHHPVSWVRLLLRQIVNPFVLVLLFAAGLAFSVSLLPGEGDRRLTAAFVLGIAVASALLSFFEEYRATRELAALDRLLVSRALVVRQGIPREVEAAQIVPGDLLILSQGHKVPADARLVEGHSLRTDESALTGESVGVDKSPDSVAPEAQLAERSSMVFASTFVTLGTGKAVVVATGMATEVGKIAGTLAQMSERPTPFQREVQKMARQMTAIVGVLAAVIAVILLWVRHEPPIDVALNTLSLAVATIPASLPLVLTFALALGAHQMSIRRAVVRRLAVVESLGSVDTICTDKTGTLTENLMTVQAVFAAGRRWDLSGASVPDPAHCEVIRAGVLCNEASMGAGPDHQAAGDPLETALLRAAARVGLEVNAIREGLPKVDELPFSAERKMMTTVHRDGERRIAFTKGAPGPVLDRSTSAAAAEGDAPADDAQLQLFRQEAARLQAEGMYVLAVARKDVGLAQGIENLERGLTFLGLVALLDPPRPEAAEALARARDAAIRIVMITGDNGLTAQGVARQLGIGERSVEARELEGLSRSALVEEMKDIDIVARATPEVKQRVLQALQDAGHFVAMTGDGVNDSTALRQADVGVAMGLRGTDIAKESAAMVLLDDNFSTIVAAVEEGRRIFDNIRKFTNYLLSTSLGEVVVVLALSIAGYFPLSAIMLLWVNVVTDVIPASALAGDPAVPQVMRRRPRHHNEPILNKAIYATIAGSVLRTLLAYGFIFWIGLKLNDLAYARTLLFTSIVLHAFTRVLVVRQLDNLRLWSNNALLWSYAAAVGLQLVALYTPLRSAFGAVPLDWQAWAVMVPVVAASSAAGVYMTRWILRLAPVWER